MYLSICLLIWRSAISLVTLICKHGIPDKIFVVALILMFFFFLL